MDTREIRVGWYETPSGVSVYSQNATRGAAGITTQCVNACILMDDIASVGWDNIEDISPDLTSVTFRLGGNVFSVVIGQQYPQQRPVLASGAFPDQAYPWSASDSLHHLCTVYTESIAAHHLYFKTIDALDREACVVASSSLPPANNRKIAGQANTPYSAVRTIVVAASPASVYCEITIHPERMHEAPMLWFFGAKADVQEFNERWGRLHHQWRHDKSITWNLETVLLGAALPPPGSHVGSAPALSALNIEDDRSLSSPPSEATDHFCSICYTMDNTTAAATTTITCSNSRCGHRYHEDCVRTWVLTSSSCKISYGVAFGVCPYCMSSIEVASDKCS